VARTMGRGQSDDPSRPATVKDALDRYEADLKTPGRRHNQCVTRA
jgi:hypothetical protein